MAELKAAPVLSTPAENLLEHDEPLPDDIGARRRSDAELRAVYEIARTAQEIRAGQRMCVALQFPDHMLGDTPRVVKLLREELASSRAAADTTTTTPTDAEEKIYILADTSYSACCVDEIAAEHASADVVVHYGRSCLSPTSRLPVLYVFTQHALDIDAVVMAFTAEFGRPAEDKVVIMADVTFQDHVAPVAARLRTLGYAHVLATSVVHRPLGSIPNRVLVAVNDAGNTRAVNDDKVDLHEYAVFHVARPPTSLLLALAARVKAFYIYPTQDTSGSGSGSGLLAPRTMGLLGRRYAKVLTMATAGVIGILVNTLSVNNYLKAVDAIRKRIADAGKKSYLVVVGKLNPVKLANFAEIDGWVVVGCWESSLVEDDAGFYQPVVTPFELDMALMSDDERIWGHKWWGGLEALTAAEPAERKEAATSGGADIPASNGVDGGVSDEEDDEVPQFDLRTGRLITTSRPMRQRGKKALAEARNGDSASSATNGNALSLRPKAELATINGVVSPGAEYLRSKRTWQGLGSDFQDEGVMASANTAIEEGRSGIARGYTVGKDDQRT